MAFHLCKVLERRHNKRDGVSNHRRLDCLLDRLFRRRSKKTSKLHVTGLCGGIHWWPINSPHKRPVTRKTFPFDDVVMVLKCSPRNRTVMWQGRHQDISSYVIYPAPSVLCSVSVTYVTKQYWHTRHIVYALVIDIYGWCWYKFCIFHMMSSFMYYQTNIDLGAADRD